jgi:hypothetical protein
MLRGSHNALRSLGTSLNLRMTFASPKPPVAGSPLRLKPITPKERSHGENAVELMEALRRSVRGASAETNAPKKSGKKPRKAAAGQQEMLMPIVGKKQKETAVKKPAARQRRPA